MVAEICFVSTSERCYFSYLSNNVAKPSSYGRKFERTLKSSLSFVLKYIFMYLTHFDTSYLSAVKDTQYQYSAFDLKI